MGICQSKETGVEAETPKPLPRKEPQAVFDDAFAFLSSINPLKTFQHKNEYYEDELEHGRQPLRFLNIVAKPLEAIANFIAPIFDKTEEDKEFIRSAIRGNFVFSHLRENELIDLVNAFEPYNAQKNAVIIQEGDIIGDYFYIIKQGTVGFSIEGKSVGQATQGASFGELALLYNSPRAATCTAMTACDLWRVDQETFRRILISNQQSKEDQMVEVLKTVDVFKNFGKAELKQVAETVSEKTYVEDEYILKFGDVLDRFYIVKEGSAIATDIQIGESKYADGVLGPGQSFGERILLNNAMPIYANIRAQTNCVMWTIDKANFLKHLGGYDFIQQRSQTKRYVRNIPIIARANLSDADFEKLAALFTTITYEKDQTITSIGQKIEPTLFMIQSGSVSKTNYNGASKVLGQNEYFGDDTFEIGRKIVESRYTIKALKKTTCQIVTYSAIAIAFASLSQRISQTTANEEVSSNPDLTLKSIEKHTLLGAGTFGQVWLVTEKRTKEPYALKVQSKRALIEYNQSEGVLREKDIMSRLHSPFIIELVNSFQDKRCLYMVTKLYQGGELFGVIHRKKKLIEQEATFYAAVIIEALSYMHQRKILYRDLKPENVLIDSEGYCIIVDLGFAKVVRNKTYTLCGTPLYIAPEVILQRGHDKGADIWSYGVLVYELIYGFTPFYKEGMDQRDLFQNICQGKYDFPRQHHASLEVVNLIKKILVLRPNQRLGNLSETDDDIRNDIWFRDINFYELQQKKIPAPWVPQVKNALDGSNFRPGKIDAADYSRDKPLTPEEQSLFQSF